jgi:hypothetical protein
MKFSHKINTLSDLDELSVWQNIIGRGVRIGERFNSPFRDSKSMSCTLNYNNGFIRFSSFSDKDSRFRGWSCVQAYGYLSGMNYNKALNYLCDKNPVKYFKPAKYHKDPPNKIITCVKEFEKDELLYWYNLGIDPKNGYIFSTESYKTCKVYKMKDFSFSYIYEPLTIGDVITNGGVKIYKQQENKKDKWRGKVGKNDTIWLKNGSNELMVCKSMKDFECLKSLVGKKFDYIHTQSEESIFDYDLSEYNSIILFWDNDTTGKKRSGYFSELLSKFAPVKCIFVPEIENITDCTDYYSQFGRFETFKLILQILN